MLAVVPDALTCLLRMSALVLACVAGHLTRVLLQLMHDPEPP